MPRESKKSKQERATRIVSTLAEVYPDAHCELNYTSPLELLIATILSAQCTDKQVNIVTVTLFKSYQSAQAFAEAPLGELENSIRRIGLFRSKAKNIKACCQTLIDQFNGDVPQTMEHLISLAGVGRKTANVVLGNAFDINLGVVVDTHVGRLAQRFRLTKETSPEKIEKDLQELIPQAQWMMLSHWLIWHGRRRCSARNPKCADCELSHLCPSADKA
ncbi:endonuclease III [Verrucomicrobia bacterium]|jgi:endonuclease III|nr:endonuclease III [Verrucomicrobiota bacterium]MDB4746312.1 endonuclease III [Verrucomicrobiota bacterium]MDB4798592.1 endonuclease III [Verrucomicrobiota bacterium]